MRKQEKKISIFIPVLNGAKTIERTLDSIESQGYKNYEVIIIDGFSTDGTQEILERRGYVYTSSTLGPDELVGVAVKSMTGDIFCVIGSDDMYYPGAFQKIADSLDTNEEEWAYGICDLYDGDVFRFHMGNNQEITKEIAIGGMPCAGVCMFFTRKLIQKVTWPNGQYICADDYGYVMKLLDAGYKPKWIDERLVRYYFTGHNLGDSPKARDSAERIKKDYREKWSL